MAPEPARNRFIREVREGDHTHPRHSIRHEATRRRSPESKDTRVPKHGAQTYVKNLREYVSSDERTVDSNLREELT